MANYGDSEIIVTKLYPIVAKSLDTNSRKFIAMIGTFFNERHKSIYEIAPYVNILYNKKDEDKIFQSLDLQYRDVLEILKECFFWDLNYSPLCAKEPYVEVLMCAVKYFVNKKEDKYAELTALYTLFTGKFYASLFSNYFKYQPKQEIMDYVVNNMLTDKFDLKKEKTIFGAMRKLANTWLTTYKDELKSMKSTDDEFGKKFIQQLRDRENSFFKNISNLYYQAAEEKLYMNYETDDLSEENFRLTDNDYAKAARITEATMGVLTSQKISISRCNICKDLANSVRPEYIKAILESIIADKENYPDLRRVISIIICDFLSNYPGGRIGGGDFIAYSIKAKPNTKNELLLEMKSLITTWLSRYSDKYRKQKRPATINAYYTGILTYFVYTITEIALK